MYSANFVGAETTRRADNRSEAANSHACDAPRPLAQIEPERQPISRKCETGRKSEIDVIEPDDSGHKIYFLLNDTKCISHSATAAPHPNVTRAVLAAI
jgi:hypothetical protein